MKSLLVKDNLNVLNQKIEKACLKSGRATEDVSIIGVTKYVSIQRAKEAIDAGVQHLGENRDEGFLAKFEEIGSNATWHYIGNLQTRKVKSVINKVDYLHSLDRLSLAKEIDKRANAPVLCFVQVNVSGEESKQGIAPEHIIEFIKELAHFPNIKVVGLMTMAPYSSDEVLLRTIFRKLRVLRDEIKNLNLDYAPCQELSMGMSNDFELAIEEGATYIRIGTSLVGNKEEE
nr:YggS family pyridoxal phosphate-dependent enzyme [Bacillus coahuilensis]